MTALDYSKWDHLEISDDEDETHPNIHTPSLHKWRHEARVERKEQMDIDKRELKKNQEKNKEEIKTISSQATDKEDLKNKLKELEEKDKKLQDEELMLIKKEKSQPWNIDTICKDGWEKTVVNVGKKEEIIDEEEKMKRSHEFMKTHEANIKQFGMMSNYDHSKDYLVRHPELVNEDTAGYLTIWCINLEVEEKHDLMKHVAKQTICLNYILELGKQLNVDPRACIPKFFQRMKTAEKTYIDAYEDEVQSFIGRVEDRAQVRIQKAMKEMEEEERKKRLGPGGLDPLEVMETLPAALKECFESQSIAKLHQALNSLAKEDAEYHMKRCVDSGLWVADAESAGLKPAREQLQEEISQNPELAGTTLNEASASDDENYETID